MSLFQCLNFVLDTGALVHASIKELGTGIHRTRTIAQRLGIHTFGIILFQTKMGDENGSEGNPDVLASLFTVTTKKAAPQYDYSSVPSRCGLSFALIPNYHFGLFRQGFD